MTQEERFRNFFSSVSHIKIGDHVSKETIESIAVAAKNVENKTRLSVDDVSWQSHYTNL